MCQDVFSYCTKNSTSKCYLVVECNSQTGLFFTVYKSCIIMNVLVDLQKQTDCSASVLCCKITSVETYFTGLLQTQSSHQNFIKSLDQLKRFTGHFNS